MKEAIRGWIKDNGFMQSFSNIDVPLDVIISRCMADIGPNWVAMTDNSLPEIGVLVLMCTTEFDGTGKPRYSVGCFDTGGWWHKNEHCASWTPTHWKELVGPTK